MRKIKEKTLLLGGSGNLGSSLIRSKFFTDLKYPTKKNSKYTFKKKNRKISFR